MNDGQYLTHQVILEKPTCLLYNALLKTLIIKVFSFNLLLNAKQLFLN